MKNLFKYAASYWKAMIAIVLILVVQAYCDLSLPAYTSDIVNVGIQQGGIEDEVPRQIATEEMEKLLLFVSEDDQQTVMDAYTEDNTSYKKEAYVLKDSVAEEENTMENLKDILQIPMMMTSGIESGSDTTKQMEDKLKEQMSQGMAQSMPQGADQTMPEGMPQGESQAVSLDDMSMFDLLKMLPAEQRATMVEKIEEQMSEMPDTILDQASVSFCRSAYKDLGMDMDQTQIHYLLKTGGQMAALALLGMVASIMVAFLASRVGASAGRDLRSGVFHKVVGFSNNEFNHFSTASLITRSTNDIQQIQMLIVMLLRMVLYAPILAIGGVLQVMKTNVSMSWIIGLAVIIIAFVVLLLFLVVMPKFKVLQNLVDKLNLVTREILTGLPVIRAFSTEKHEEERFDESVLAEKTAQLLGRKFSRSIITPEQFFDIVPYVMYNMEQPLGDASAIVFTLGCNATAEHTKICYSGEGSDEFFGGYNMYRNAERYGENLKNFYVGNTNIMKEDEKQKILKKYDPDVLPIELARGIYEETEGLDPLTKMSDVDIQIWLEGDIYLNVDKMSTAAGLEIRMPLTDRRIFDIASRMPSRFKVNEEQNKVAFRTAAAKVLPEEIAFRKKLGFIVPIRIWMADERYNQDVQRLFHSDIAEKFFDVDAINAIFDEYVGGNSDNWRKVWTIYTFLVWYEEYFVKR